MGTQLTNGRENTSNTSSKSCVIGLVSIFGLVVFLVVILPCLVIFTNIGFFLAYGVLLSKLDPRFAMPGINVAVREGIISTIIGGALILSIIITVAALSNSSRWLAKYEDKSARTARTNALLGMLVTFESYIKILINLTIPLFPLITARAIQRLDVYPIGIMIATCLLLYLLSRPRHFSKFFDSFGSIVIRSSVDGVSIGMLYYYLFWRLPWNFGITLSSFSLETTFVYSIIAAAISVAFSVIYFGLIRPNRRPRLRKNTLFQLSALILNLPMYFLLLGAVPAVDSLRDHNITLAATFAGVGAVAATVAKLLAGGFVAGIGQSIWRWVQRWLFGSRQSSERALVSVIVESDIQRRD